MCIFCAAIPAAISLGAVAKAKQKQASLQLEDTSPEVATVSNIAAEVAAARSSNVPEWALKVPVGKTTTAICAGLITASVVYHARFGPI
jgi:hypothetical protein